MTTAHAIPAAMSEYRLRDRLILIGLAGGGLVTVAWWSALAYGVWSAIG